MDEYGLFSDEGCIERGFFSFEKASLALKSRYTSEDDLKILVCCHDHPDNAADTCEDCQGEG